MRDVVPDWLFSCFQSPTVLPLIVLLVCAMTKTILNFIYSFIDLLTF